VINFVLFDGSSRNKLLPFTYTRPVADIRIGVLTIREKWERCLEADTSSITEEYLKVKFPYVFGSDNIYVNAGFLPDMELVKAIKALNIGQAITFEDELIAYRTNTSVLPEEAEDVLEKITYSRQISKISHSWDIFAKNNEAIIADFELLTKGRSNMNIPKTAQVTAPENIFIEDSATIEHCIINATEGPVYIGKEAKILEGSMLRGPLAIGDAAVVKMGAKIYGGTTIGPGCKVGGEINNSVLFANSNKAHDGYLGNSVIGEWCNLGADTNTSNLKNNYAEVRLWNYAEGRFSPTGLQFCGLMMGDHSKCGINTMFNTGTVIGVNVNIYGSGFPRNFVPSFSWGGAAGFTTYQTRKAFEVMRAVMKRKDLEVSEVDIQLMNHVFDITKKWRKD
jgi:UDP-N-acetylglucosamine diphosphorylase/glucosamine-1-phosphate N-acetyltransferase